MVTEARNCWQNGSNDDDYKTIIANLNYDKLKLLKEQKTLYLLLAEKEEQILKMTETYKTKWETVCDHLRNIEKLCTSETLPQLKTWACNLLDSTSSPPVTNMDCSISSYLTETSTDTVLTESMVESNISSSSESVVARPYTEDTLTKMGGFKSLSNLVNDVTPPQKEYRDSQAANLDQTLRSHSDCVQDSNNCLARRSRIESDTSESLFRVPENCVRRSRKLTKKKTLVKSDFTTARDKPICAFTNQEMYTWLLNVARLPSMLVEDIKVKGKISASSLDQITEHKFEKLFGINDKLIKKKVLLAVEQYKSSDGRKGVPDGDLASKDHFWVANVWLKRHVGLSHLSTAFLSRCIDGRILKHIAESTHSRMKELIGLAASTFEWSSSPCLSSSGLHVSNINKAIFEPSKNDLRSLRFALELFIKFDFNLQELESRRAACEELHKDVLVWTNERIAKWFQGLNLKNYIRGIEYSGIHGAMMVLDPQFTVSTIPKLIQIPSEIVKKNNLDDKISILLKPSRFNEGVKSRRSTSIFRRRSLSQPKYSKSVSGKSRTSNVTPEISDSASNNDSMLNNIGPGEKYTTLDMSHSPSRNNNFVRTYRKPDQPKISVTDVDTDGENWSSLQIMKSPKPWTASSPFVFQVPRKLRAAKSGSDQEDQDYEI